MYAMVRLGSQGAEQGGAYLHAPHRESATRLCASQRSRPGRPRVPRMPMPMG